MARNERTIRVEQLCACAFAGGLAPAAAGAGRGWQGALLAAPVLLLLGGVLIALAPRWEKIAALPVGAPLRVLFALWGVFYLGRGLGRAAERIRAAGGAPEQYAPWLIALIALPLLWMALGKSDAFFRAGELFCPVVLWGGAVLVIWGLFHVEWRYAALPAPDLWGGFWSALESGSGFLFALPLLPKTRVETGDGKRAFAWLFALAAANVLLSLAAVGVLSPAVAAEASEPFFLMTATLGRAVRVEGLATALWLFSDLCALGLFSRSWEGKREIGYGPFLAVLAGAAGAMLGVIP